MNVLPVPAQAMASDASFIDTANNSSHKCIEIWANHAKEEKQKVHKSC